LNRRSIQSRVAGNKEGGELTTEDNGVEFTHPRIQNRGRRYESVSYGNQTEREEEEERAKQSLVVMPPT
jgi:hypothetical protein